MSVIKLSFQAFEEVKKNLTQKEKEELAGLNLPEDLEDQIYDLELWLKNKPHLFSIYSQILDKLMDEDIEGMKEFSKDIYL